MMNIDLRIGERLLVGDTVIRLERKSGQIARLVVDAARDLVVRREADKEVPSKKSEPERKTI